MYKGLNSENPSNLVHAKRLSEQVICLPIYPELEKEDVNRIVSIIKK